MTSGRPGATPQDWLPRLLPLTLLIILGLAGLRGVVANPRWNGPMHRDGLVIGLALEVLLGILLVITIRRRAAAWTRRGPAAVNPVAVKLRGVLIFVLSAGMIAVAVTILVGLHLHLFTGQTQRADSPAHSQGDAQGHGSAAGIERGSTFHFPLAALLYGLARRGAPGRSRAQHLVGPAAAAVGRAPGRTTSSRRTPRTCGRRWSRAVRRCAPSTMRGPPSSRATWRWKQPGRTRHGPGHRRYARRIAGAGDRDRHRARHRRRAADRALLRGQVLQPSA